MHMLILAVISIWLRLIFACDGLECNKLCNTESYGFIPLSVSGSGNSANWLSLRS